MRKTIILLGTVIFLFAVAIPVSASDVIISKDRLPYFIGTYDAASNSFTSYDVSGWDEDPMSYTTKVSALPDKEGVYYGFAIWYTNLVNAILEIPEDKIVYAAIVDLKKKNEVVPLITKWAIEGDNVRLICITGNFPGMAAAPTLDGSYVFENGERFLVTRSGGGDMKEVWRQYCFIIDKGDCQWEIFYEFMSATKQFEKEYIDGWCRMLPELAPDYNMMVYKRVFQAVGDPLDDGSFQHEMVSYDSTVVSLWDIAQKKK
ncbi:MAG: hypothetical protein R3F48_02495 [Candidatus Zixiibacteriota bacterium]